jgi:hypothetical protein
MRLRVLLVFGALVSALPASARDPMLKDGRFTICAFQDFDKCELLAAPALRRYHPTAHNRRVLAELKRYAASNNITAAALQRSFGKPSKIIPHDNSTDQTYAWFRNSVGLNDLNAKCPECGLYIRLSGKVAVSLNYIVDEKFTLAWNRAPQ